MSNWGIVRPQEAARAIKYPKLLTVIDQTSQTFLMLYYTETSRPNKVWK